MAKIQLNLLFGHPNLPVSGMHQKNIQTYNFLVSLFLTTAMHPYRLYFAWNLVFSEEVLGIALGQFASVVELGQDNRVGHAIRQPWAESLEQLQRLLTP